MKQLNDSSVCQLELRCALAYCFGVEADNPGEKVDLLDTFLGHSRIYLRNLASKIIERAFAQFPLRPSERCKTCATLLVPM